MLAAVSASAQTPTISPLNPVVALSGTVQINCTANCGSGGTFTCANTSNGGACFGSVSSAGLYTAPATLAANQSIGGYQLLPNDHIFNTRVDGLALRSDSATLMASVGSAAISFLAAYPINYADGSTPGDTLSFYYTPANNGSYPSPVWPSANVENGWFDALGFSGNDHHVLVVDTTNGNLNERYQYYAQAPISSCSITTNVGTCIITSTNTSSGFSLPNSPGRSIQIGGFTAGDTYLNGTFTLSSATPTTIVFPITHANASTGTTGNVTFNSVGGGCSTTGACNSQEGFKYTYADYSLPANGAANAAGTAIIPLTLRSQEFTSAVINGGAIKHAMQMSLSNGYICASSTANACAGNAVGTRHIWPATAEAFLGGGIIPYGLRFRLKSSFDISGFSAAAQIILTALKNYGLIVTDGGLSWQVSVDFDNMPKAEAAALRELSIAGIATSNWEVPDESTLMETATSGAANNGEIVTYTSSTGTAATNIDIQGTAVNVNTNQYYIMAGTPAQQLVKYSNGATTCSMSPTVGAITSGCLYTPPASVTIGTTSATTVTVTSNVTGTVKGEILITVFPATNFNIIQADSDFVDSNGVTWFSGGKFGFGMSSVPSWEGCCQNDGSFPNIVDKQLWWNILQSSSTIGDYKIDVHVPAGTYQVTFNNGTIRPVGQNVRFFYAQGALVATVDSTASVGGLHLPYTLLTNLTVGANNTLSFYNAGIGNEAWSIGDISSLFIHPIPVSVVAAPVNKAGLLP